MYYYSRDILHFIRQLGLCCKLSRGVCELELHVKAVETDLTTCLNFLSHRIWQNRKARIVAVVDVTQFDYRSEHVMSFLRIDIDFLFVLDFFTNKYLDCMSNTMFVCIHCLICQGIAITIALLAVESRETYFPLLMADLFCAKAKCHQGKQNLEFTL